MKEEKGAAAKAAKVESVEPSHYPSWRYHKTLEPKVVENESEDKALGKGWEHSPAAFELKESKE